MQMRELGRSGLKVAPWCFGGNVFGWTADRDTSFRLLDAFMAHGFNFIDTADVYSRWVEGHRGGESETIIGEWLRGRGGRDRVVIATKFGMDMGPGKDNLSAAYMVEAVEASLKRLQVETIDLYQSHRDDPKTPVAETLEAYGRLIRAGKVRAIGASNFDAPRLRGALDAGGTGDLPRYESLQPEYNLVERAGFEADLQRLCVERGVGVIPYFSLASGFLSGKYRSEADLGKSQRGGRVTKYMNKRGWRILAALDQVSDRHGVEPAAVALAWLMAQPSVTAPIASATRVDQLEALARAAEINLSENDLNALDKASREQP